MNWRSKETLERGLGTAGPHDLAGLWSTLDTVVRSEEGSLSAAALATVAAASHDRPQAMSMLSNVARQHGRAAFRPTAVAFFQRELGDEAAALASFRQATHVDPEYAEAWLGLGMLLDDQGDPTGLPALERAATLDPANVEAWKRIGDAHCSRGRFSQAVDAYDRGLVVQPDHTGLGFHRCRALAALGCHEEAMAATPRVIRRDLGILREVQHVAGGRVFVCRYWAADDVAELFEELAITILERASDLAATDLAFDDGVCLDVGSAPLRVVERLGMFVVCDADCGRGLRPDRFGELNEAISLLYAQQSCLRSTGLDGEECRWTDLVRVQAGALEQFHLRLRRTESAAGFSGWTLRTREGAADHGESLVWEELPVYELRQRRPSLTRFLGLPPGVELEIDGAQLRRLEPLRELDESEHPSILH